MTEVVVLSVVLAIDAVAASVSLACGRAPRSRLLLAVVLFGVFQAGMAGAGAMGGVWLEAHAAMWDHWLAAALLAVVGGRMIVGTSSDEESVSVGIGGVLALAVATSIDALASGVSVPLLEPAVWVSLMWIGVTTTLLSGLGAALSSRISERFTTLAERFGGVVLIGIGARILITHLLDHG